MAQEAKFLIFTKQKGYDHYTEIRGGERDNVPATSSSVVSRDYIKRAITNHGYEFLVNKNDEFIVLELTCKCGVDNGK